MPGAKIFISYKHNHPESERIRQDIEAKLLEQGYEILVDHTIQGGDRWSPRLYQWALECAAGIVLATPEAKQSDWCQREWHVLAARSETSKIPVIPICIGLQPSELGALAGMQAILADENAVPRALAALSRVQAWQISPNDYLALHQAWNRYQLTSEPVFAREKFTLEDMYQETECGVMTWGQISPGASGTQDPFEEKNGGRQSLVDVVMSYVRNSNFRDAVVVQGPAGAGKSAFTLRLVQTLESEGLRAVRLRFRDMRLATHDSVDELLADAVRVGPESEQPPTPTKDLFDEERLRQTITIDNFTLCRWVFILDGWDEVSLAGSAGYQAQLRTWLPKIREFIKRSGPPVRLIITGRPSVELKESGFLYKETPVLTVRPLRPEQLEALANTLAKKSDWNLEPSRCKPILDQYTKWFQSREKGGAEMVGLPLLAFLTFRTIAEWKGDIDHLLDSPSALYAALIDQTVANSGKGVPAGLEGTVQRGGENLRRLLTRTAAIISIFWSERISFEELRTRLEEEGDLEEWVSTATSNNPLHELVVNYYFKGGHNDLGCEFLHKSFREYLFAESILLALEEIAGDRTGRLAPPQLPYWKDFDEGTPWHQASRVVAKLVSPTGVTPEVQAHLFWLVDRAISRNIDRWIYLRDLLADVYGWWAEGVHLRPQPIRERGQLSWKSPYVTDMVKWALPYTKPNVEPPRTASMDANLGYAMIRLTAHVHYRLLSSSPSIEYNRPYQTQRGTTLFFRPGNNFFSPIAARWQTIFYPFFPAVALPAADLSGEQLGEIDFSRADLVEAWLTRANLSGANLEAANLARVRLQEADLTFANLNKANLFDADLTQASLNQASLVKANLYKADLRGAFLRKANLNGANLKLANLSRLSDNEGGHGITDLSGASLIRADLGHALLCEADLMDADLRNANLRGADLRGANLRGADLTDAVLNDALLEGALLE